MRQQARVLLRSKFIRDTLTLQASRLFIVAISLLSFWITVRLMGVERYGVWKLVLAFFGIWQAFELSGVGVGTSTRLARAAGKGDAGEILDMMAFYVKIVLSWALLTVIVLFIAGPPIAARLYDGDSRIGGLAAWFSLTLAADTLYVLVLLSLQSRRLMRDYALLQNVNQVVLAVCVIGAMLVRPTPESMLVARLVYSYATMAVAFVLYARRRGAGAVSYPPLGAVFRRAWRVPVRPYWRSGVAMAVDKNLAGLYSQVPMTLVGVLAGEAAAGYLGAGLDLINRSNLLTTPVLDNLQAVVPQAVGREDFVRLRRNFGRVLRVMALAAVGFFGTIALAAPLVVPLLFPDMASGTVPVVVALTVFGAVTMVGGIFGPLYRALDQMRAALAAKIAAGLIMLPVGWWLITQWDALGAAWMINGAFVISVALTAVFTLPALHRRAVAVRERAG